MSVERRYNRQKVSNDHIAALRDAGRNKATGGDRKHDLRPSSSISQSLAIARAYWMLLRFGRTQSPLFFVSENSHTGFAVDTGKISKNMVEQANSSFALPSYL